MEKQLVNVVSELYPVTLGRIAETRAHGEQGEESKRPALTGRHAFEIQELADIGYEGI